MKMSRMYFSYKVFPLLIWGVLWGCVRPSNPPENSADSLLIEIDSALWHNAKPHYADENTINEIVQSIPSSLEAVTVIQEGSRIYLKQAAHTSPEGASELQKAINLGMYSSDLGYAAVNNHFDDFLSFLGLVHKLKDQLSIQHEADYAIIQAAKSPHVNIDVLDSLLQISTLNFERTTYQLTENKKQHVAIAILTGAWIEYSYMQASIYKENHNKKLRFRLIEQKLILERLISLLEKYPEINKPLLQDMTKIYDLYHNIHISQCNDPATMKLVGDSIVIETNCEHPTEDIKDEDFDKICKILLEMHNKWRF